MAGALTFKTAQPSTEFRSHSRMHDAVKPMSALRTGKRNFTEPDTVDPPVTVQYPCPEGRYHLSIHTAAGPHQFPGNLVSLADCEAFAGKNCSHEAFAAGDATGNCYSYLQYA
jgi:hypothetical protein